MNTLMTNGIFSQLSLVRRKLVGRFKRGDIASIFVPWAGPQLKTDGGIYYVGMATDGEFGGDSTRTFSACYEETAKLCNGRPHDRSNTPFWRYLNELSINYLGEPYHRTAALWGWSNLLKIGYSRGSPKNWPREIQDRQRVACIASLRAELGGLRRTLVHVVSNNEFGVFQDALRPGVVWEKEYENDGIYWWWDDAAENLYIHGYHPKFVYCRPEYKQFARTLDLANRFLPRRPAPC